MLRAEIYLELFQQIALLELRNRRPENYDTQMGQLHTVSYDVTAKALALLVGGRSSH